MNPADYGGSSLDGCAGCVQVAANDKTFGSLAGAGADPALAGAYRQAIGLEGGAAGDAAMAAADAAAEDGVIFGSVPNQVYHSFRYTDSLGLPRADVITSVNSSLTSQIGPFASGAPINITTSVNGVNITYTAYQLDGGIFNIGRIVPGPK
jgi:hypothetical protein